MALSAVALRSALVVTQRKISEFGSLMQASVSACHTKRWHHITLGYMLSDLSSGMLLSA